MTRHLSILLALFAGCSAPEGTKAPPDETSPTESFDLVDWYDGTVELADGTEREADIRFVAEGDDRAVMRIGPFDPAWGYSAEFRVDGGNVFAETGAPRGPAADEWGALTLTGSIDDDVVVFDDIVAVDGGEVPFDLLRMVPHDGVKPVLDPIIQDPYDPEPVAGIYYGSVFALGATTGACVLAISGDPFMADAFDCHEVGGLQMTTVVLWDDERSVMNIGPVGEGFTLVAKLSALHDGTLKGVIADIRLGASPVTPDEVAHEALIGLVTLREAGQ